MYLNELMPQYERPSFLMKRRINRTPGPFIKMKTKPKDVLINQLLVRVVDFFYLFMETSSIQGFNHITSKNHHILEYILWLATVVAAICGAVSISLTTWSRYQENPTVVSMERNYKEWNTSFPAVTVCPTAKIGDIKLKASFQNQLSITDMALARNFLDHLANATYVTFGAIPKFEQLKSSQYLSTIYHLHYDFKYNVSNSNLEIYNVVTMAITMTEMGICYAYNSAIASYNDPGCWSTGALNFKKHNSVLTGSPLDGDIFAQIMNMNSGYMMYVHSPTETPDAAFKMWKSTNNSYKTLDISALSIYSTEETRSLSVGQRKCRLLDESNLKISPVYSYNLCRMECRMKLSFSLCKCVPYFYRPIANYKVCDVEGMGCLAKYADILVKLRYDDSKKVNCPCLPPCDDVNYVIESDNNMDWSLGTNLKWGLVKYPRFRFKRDILFGFSDLLVAIGGTAGLFFGCSVLSVVEIFYFFTLRLLLYAVQKESKWTTK